MNTLQEKRMSLQNRPLQPKMHSVSKLSLISTGHRASVLYRTAKTGFKVPKYQNTYRLESRNPFKCEVVDSILKEVMCNFLNGVKYDPTLCLQLCKDMSAEVRDRIFKKCYDRYKHVVVISIIQKLGQSIRTDFGKLWDVDRDNYSSYVLETPDFVAIGLVAALYYE